MRLILVMVFIFKYYHNEWLVNQPVSLQVTCANSKYVVTNSPSLSAATERTPVIIDPCFPSPCGSNADCIDRNGVGACTCLAGFQGDPYSGCRRECDTNPDCAPGLACIRFKCADPCPGTCGTGADCAVINHIPTCSCPPGYTGDPFLACRPAPLARKYTRDYLNKRDSVLSNQVKDLSLTVCFFLPC